ncbi:MAG: cytochrome c [Pelagimonas sp.]|jgi:hypothetical protein|nr:cytochrome c [Pelagimonas sp.]
MRLVLATALCLAAPALAQDADIGMALYHTHCATCHGVDGHGDGPMAGVLMIPPTDLTQLAKRSDGTFPVLRVVKRIDGRDPVVSHGSPMPVYGDYFEAGTYDVAIKTPSGQPILAAQPLVHLLAYLRQIQQLD